MLEIEIKYLLADEQKLRQQLLKWGADDKGIRTDIDHYLNAPDRDFAITREAFRIRSIGPKNYLTWKGPVLDTQTKTRKEIEIALADGDEAGQATRELFTHLGYRPVATVKKQRERFHFQREGFDIEVTIDEVEHVGRYVELEILATEDLFEPAKSLLLRLAEEAGLSQMERRSYLELVLHAQNQ
jgi:adenylate cyclase class 2